MSGSCIESDTHGHESDTVNINLTSIKQPHRLLVGCFFFFFKKYVAGSCIARVYCFHTGNLQQIAIRIFSKVYICTLENYKVTHLQKGYRWIRKRTQLTGSTGWPIKWCNFEFIKYRLVLPSHYQHTKNHDE